MGMLRKYADVSMKKEVGQYSGSDCENTLFCFRTAQRSFLFGIDPYGFHFSSVCNNGGRFDFVLFLYIAS